MDTKYMTPKYQQIGDEAYTVEVDGVLVGFVESNLYGAWQFWMRSSMSKILCVQLYAESGSRGGAVSDGLKSLNGTKPTKLDPRLIPKYEQVQEPPKTVAKRSPKSASSKSASPKSAGGRAPAKKRATKKAAATNDMVTRATSAARRIVANASLFDDDVEQPVEKPVKKAAAKRAPAKDAPVKKTPVKKVSVKKAAKRPSPKKASSR